MSQFSLGPQIGYQQLSAALSSAQSLTVPSGTRGILVRCSVQNVRWRADGTAPTSSLGMLMTPTDDLLGYFGNVRALQFIQVTSGAVLDVNYYGG